MRKIYCIVLAALLTFFACTLPREFEIIASTPAFKFSSEIDINKELFNMIKDVFEDNDDMDIKMLDCTARTDVQAYIIHMLALDETINLQEIMDPSEYNRVINIVLVQFEDPEYLFSLEDLGNSPIELPFSEIGESLGELNFKEDEIKARMYINFDNDFIKDIGIKVDFIELDEDGNETNPDIPLGTLQIPAVFPTELNRESSNIDLSGDIYSGLGLPAGGIDIDCFPSLLNSKKNVRVKIKAFIQPDVIVRPREHLHGKEFNISAEVVVWLPLALEAAPGVTVVLSESFDEIGDYIETVTDMTDIIDNLVLEVDINMNPFNDGLLVIKQPGTELNIVNPLNMVPLRFFIGNQDIKIIESLGKNFKPEISLCFPQASSIRIPRDLGITTVSVSAKINYTIDLW